MKDLSDIEWVSIDLLMAARKAGLQSVSRKELLFADSAIPEGLRMKITFALLLLANGPLVEMHGDDDFALTDAGVQLYVLRWGAKAQPVAVDVILLPDLSGERYN